MNNVMWLVVGIAGIVALLTILVVIASGRSIPESDSDLSRVDVHEVLAEEDISEEVK